MRQHQPIVVRRCEALSIQSHKFLLVGFYVAYSSRLECILGDSQHTDLAAYDNLEFDGSIALPNAIDCFVAICLKRVLQRTC